MKGIRFILLLLPPLIISSGIMVGLFIEHIDTLKSSERFKIVNNRKYLVNLLSICFLLAILSPAVIDAHETSSILIPGADDDLWNVSKWIYKNTPQDTVIISHWEHGHFFTAIANRPVTVDGSSQNTPRTYWIYRAFSTSNENLSAGIFRMLATSGDEGYLTLDEYTKNTTKTVEILNKILGVDKKTAKKILKTNYNFDDNQAENILMYSHAHNPNPFILVTNDEMIDAGEWIFKYGMWKFANSNNENYTYSVGRIKINETHLITNDEIIMDLKTNAISWKGIKPYSTITISNGEIKRHPGDKNSNICIILIIGEKKSIVMDRQFENSLFTKLVLEKANTIHFKSVHKENTVTVWNLIH
jgi:dolichyl-diphosphooligosaccharide--protein glycosyltransferase